MFQLPERSRGARERERENGGALVKKVRGAVAEAYKREDEEAEEEERGEQEQGKKGLKLLVDISSRVQAR